MLNRLKANNFLREKINQNINDIKWGNNISLAANKRFGIPVGVTQDICMKNDSVDNLNDFILYAIISVVDSKVLPDYFTTLEIASYSNEVYNNSIEVPREFRVIQISEDQWLGRINVTDWMKLRDLQIINYNENTQRPLKKIIRGEQVEYKIDINKGQVEDIYNSIMNDTYIPDTITLNLPEDAVFEYDDTTTTLNIMYYDHFDITDGMHRYLAFSRAYEAGKDLSNFYEELRITSFDESKSNDFIWQQDQKYKMTKVASQSFNSDSIGVKICQKLNNNSAFKNQINKTDGLINFITMSSAITTLFNYEHKSKSLENQVENKRYEVNLGKEISKSLESIIEEKPELLTTKWDDKYIVAFICAIKLNVADYNLLEFCDTLSQNPLKKLDKTSIMSYLKLGGDLYV